MMLALLIALLALFVPSAARAGDPPLEPLEIAVEIDCTALEPGVASRLEGQLREEMRDLIKLQSHEPRAPGRAPRAVRTSLSYIDESERIYAIHIDFVDEAGLAEPIVAPSVCSACNERRLIERTLEAFRLATARLHDFVADDEVIEAPLPQIPQDRVEPIGALGYTGIGVSSGGLVMSALGVGFIARDPQTLGPTIALGIGLSAIGFGAAAILGDVIHRRISGARPHQRPRIQPALGEVGIGFSFGL